MIRFAIASLIVASTALIVTAVTPGIVAASQTNWSAPLNVDGSNFFSSVSCASPQFCAAVDSAGNALTYNGSSWSAPAKITEGGIASVSCPSTTFCVAVGSGGGENTWNGSSWNGPGPVGSDTSNLNSVSCNSSQFCVAVDDNGGADTWNGTSWSGPIAIDPAHAVVSVSCTSTTFCVAVGNNTSHGFAIIYNGTSWSGPKTVHPGFDFASVSCVSTTFCVAVDGNGSTGSALTYNGSSWSTVTIDGAPKLNAVSCATTSFCVAVDNSGNALTYNGSSWSSLTIDANGLSGASCPTAGFCVAVDNAGDVVTYGWVSANYTCNVPGLGATQEAMLLSESPSPPPSIAAPGTFQSTLSVDVTIPSAVIDSAIAEGATSITIGSQSTTVNALTGGSPSTSVNPNTLSASATDLPITFTPQMGVPYTYATTYNPETWRTVNVPGTVDFTPGEVDPNFTYLISGVPTPVSVTCTPPSGVAALDTTNVTSPGTTPSFQVPPSVPPLQSQVSAPFDGGWAIEIANTSTSPVTGLSAAITVNGGGGTLTYDLAGMSHTGTTCASTGPNTATCDVGTLSGGTTQTLNVLVKTIGLTQGTSVSGNVNVTSSNAPTQSSSLNAVNVVVIPNGATAVAVPTVALTSTSTKLSVSGAKVTLKLPRKVPVMGPSAPDTDSGPLATIKGPPVSVTLQPLTGSQDPELCPPSTGGCQGDIMEIEGNFSAYTSTAHPIVLVVKIFYGTSVPAGSMYFQSSASAIPALLPKCVLTGVDYNTPCRYGAEKIVGTAGNLSTSDTVLFNDGDPLVGRR